MEVWCYKELRVLKIKCNNAWNSTSNEFQLKYFQPCLIITQLWAFGNIGNEKELQLVQIINVMNHHSYEFWYLE